MAQQIAIYADQVAASYNLGTSKTVYKPSTISSMVGGFIFALIGIAWAVGAYYITNSIISSSPLSGFPPVLVFVIPSFGLIIMLVGLGLIIKAYLNRNLRVLIYEYGLVFIKRSGTEVIRWDQIAFVWHKVKKTTSTNTTTNYSTGYTTTTTSTRIDHSYIVQRVDGAKIVFDQTFSRLRELGKTIEQESARYLYPQAVAAYNTGRPLVFGKMTVRRAGLSDGRKTLSWNELKSIKVDANNGAIAIRKQGKWLNWSNISLSETPNIIVFEALVNGIAGVWP